MLKNGTIAAIVFGLLAGTGGLLLLGYIYSPLCCGPAYQALAWFGMGFGAVVGLFLFPRKGPAEFRSPRRLVQYMSLVILLSGIVMLSLGLATVGVGLLWLSYQVHLSRAALVIIEGTPFLILAVLFCIATFGLLRLRTGAWWLALAGSLGALVHGIFRSFVAPFSFPGESDPWLLSTLGGWWTLLLGGVALAHLLGAFRFYHRG